MAKISLESTDTTLYVSGPSIFSVSKIVANDPSIDFKIFLETKEATADLSKIGNAASSTILSLPGNSTVYSQYFNAKLGIIRILEGNKIVASLPIEKGATTSNVQLHFPDYLADTNVYLSNKTSKTLVLDSEPNLLPTVKLTSNKANVTEGETITYTVSLDNKTTTNLDIPYKLSGTGIITADFTNLTSLTDGVIRIPAGEITASFTLNTVDDGISESAETISVKLSTVAGAKVNETPVTTTIAISQSPNKIPLSNVLVTATAAEDWFIFDFQMIGGRVTKATTTGEVTITGFNPLNDKLVFNDVGTGTAYTEAKFMVLLGVVISENPFTNNTTIYVDPLAGVPAGVTIVGILDENLTKITLETTA
jgi:hypothetical protein